MCVRKASKETKSPHGDDTFVISKLIYSTDKAGLALCKSQIVNRFSQLADLLNDAISLSSPFFVAELSEMVRKHALFCELMEPFYAVCSAVEARISASDKYVQGKLIVESVKTDPFYAQQRSVVGRLSLKPEARQDMNKVWK